MTLKIQGFDVGGSSVKAGLVDVEVDIDAILREVVEDFTSTARGAGGFGSSGHG